MVLTVSRERRGRGTVTVRGSMPMELSTQLADDLRAAAEGGPLPAAAADRVSAIPLASALEIVCAWDGWERAGRADAAALLPAWARRFPIVARARAALALGRADAVGDWDAPPTEVRPVPTRAAISGAEFTTFEQRFKRSLERNGGFAPRLATALSAAFHEMVDNVIQHSGPSDAAPARGIIGYSVGQGTMTFAVADLGRGVLTSLRTNPAWIGLGSSREALVRAIRDRATRRTNVPKGGGFDQVHRALADRNGVLRFRSGDSALTLDGRGQDRQVTTSDSPAMAGFQLSVTCAI
jgi:hypothetical protein